MKTVGVDYDGTIVYNKTHEEVPFAIMTIKEMQAKGHKIILFTCRTGDSLDRAVDYMKLRQVSLYGVNDNPLHRTPNGKKVLCDYYIDDKAIGCPLVDEAVNWRAVRDILKQRGLV